MLGQGDGAVVLQEDRRPVSESLPYETTKGVGRGQRGFFGPQPAGETPDRLPAVLIAAFIVKSLPLNAMRWLVVVVVLYAAVAMLRSAFTEGRAAQPVEGAEAAAGS